MDQERPIPPASPTSPAQPALNPTLRRNIDALVARRKAVQQRAGPEEKAAAAISRFAGSMTFVYIHLVLFGGWILINLGLVPFLPAWDPTLVVLAMIASVEAIFLSTFVLINQNRMAAEDDARADLDLQVNLLNEHETTRLITMVDAIARHLQVERPEDPEVEELKRDVAPDAVMEEIAARNGQA
ncbi:hypothetical protein BJF93_12470 [Xaviernesmea oryzae]|uniref:DUF1003 domain-containing protein n=1 Tax=Xaviernesmea oryzae TaxID=464029 RepID=A0A1Q9B3J3_9HYPH|nr:DUF1003 domain-containing protein [Xaviernesmea oryzae]OLP62618.1 hypothetical protein BJF93_12470 [Xaviernesmea oryzae]SEM25671.1 Uncharacterized membrane protein [Xaviernesmea oryzae]